MRIYVDMDAVLCETAASLCRLAERAFGRQVSYGQVFDFDLIRGALKKAELEDWAVTDDCSAVELMGMNVKIVEGDERNIKVTTPMDLKIAEMLLEEMK